MTAIYRCVHRRGIFDLDHLKGSPSSSIRLPLFLIAPAFWLTSAYQAEHGPSRNATAAHGRLQRPAGRVRMQSQKEVQGSSMNAPPAGPPPNESSPPTLRTDCKVGLASVVFSSQQIWAGGGPRPTAGLLPLSGWQSGSICALGFRPCDQATGYTGSPLDKVPPKPGQFPLEVAISRPRPKREG